MKRVLIALGLLAVVVVAGCGAAETDPAEEKVPEGVGKMKVGGDPSTQSGGTPNIQTAPTEGGTPPADPVK